MTSLWIGASEATESIELLEKVSLTTSTLYAGLEFEEDLCAALHGLWQMPLY